VENLAFQNFEKKVSVANPDSDSDDALGLIKILQMEPCPPFVAKSMFAHYDGYPLFKASNGTYAKLFPKTVVGNNSKQEDYAPFTTGALGKITHLAGLACL